MTAIEKEAIAAIASRYSRTGTRFYVRGKLGSDPICAQVVEVGKRLGGLGDVVDVGCGRGQMLLLLRHLGLLTSGTGFDWDQPKIAEATAAAGEGLSFHAGDVRQRLEACDTVLMLDVLHYLKHEEQDELVDRVAAAARRAVIIRELDPDRGWRSTVTRVQEGITTFFGYNVGERVLIRPIAAVAQRLEAAGFAVEVVPSWGSTPFANVAIMATR